MAMNLQTPTTLPPNGQPFWLKKIFQAGFQLAFGGVDIGGINNVPADGPLIIASNHRSYLDPVILASFLPRRVYHMAKRELFHNPAFARLITFFGAFPVDREGTRASTFRMALRLLRLGGAVVIFPEGGIVNSMGEAGIKEGVGTLAALGRAPVLPVYIAGSNSLVSPGGILNPWLAIRVGRSYRAERSGGGLIPQGIRQTHRRRARKPGGGLSRRTKEAEKSLGLARMRP